MADKKAVPQAQSASNEPQDYEVLRKFRLSGRYHPKGSTLSLKPSQANYFVTTEKLKLKGAK